MTAERQRLLLVAVLAWASLTPAGRQAVGSDAEPPSPEPLEGAPRIYVPFGDLAAVIDPAAKAVLMDRGEFAKLLAAAGANAAADAVELGQVATAEYVAAVEAQKLTFAGELTVVSMSDRPVSVPLAFAQIGITEMRLDGEPAPLGYDEHGKLALIVVGKGPHRLTVSGSAVLTDLMGGGMRFAVSLPVAVAGKMTLTAPGDLDVQATAPIASCDYDKQADKTVAEIILGGHESLAVTLMGNGRLEEQGAMLLGESASTVTLTKSHQILDCTYTVQILRRGVRRLRFAIPAQWTVTDVSSPNLVRWSVLAPEDQGPAALEVEFGGAARGLQCVHIQATAPRRAADKWRSPRVSLLGAAFQRGYLLVSTGEDLRVRAETLTRARREDFTAAAAKMLATAAGRLYYHWSDRWSVELDLATVALRTASDERLALAVGAKQLTIDGQFRITPAGRELFEMSFLVPRKNSGWEVTSVTVNGSKQGFEFRRIESPSESLLKIELARPVRPEGTANVVISLRHVPTGWDWSAEAKDREVAFPLLGAVVDKITGLVAVSAREDLDVSVLSAAEMLDPVTVGRMSLLGLSRDVQAAYTYHAAAEGQVNLRVSRRRPRLSAESVGLVTAERTKLTGDWRITYNISRAQTRRLYLLAEKSLGRQIKIEAPGRRISSKNIVAPGGKTLVLPQALAEAYDLWQLTLDGEATGTVPIVVHYDRPLPEGRFDVPLIRPAGAAQASELLAVQASEELALAVDSRGVGLIDALDLPPLPGQVRRLLAAFRLEGTTPPSGADAGVTLETTVHETYAIPPALATTATLTTYLDARGAQRTDAVLQIVNAGVQFLTIRLPEHAKLWSVRVGADQAKPKRNARGDYLVSLPRWTSPQPVKVIYASGPEAGTSRRPGRVKLTALALPGMRINELAWEVYPPPGYRITSQDSRMDSPDMPRPVPAYIKTLEAVPTAVLLGPSLGSDRARELAKSAVVASNLKGIGVAIDMYRHDHDGDYPESLDQLAAEGYVDKDALVDQQGHRVRYSRPEGKREAGEVIASALVSDDEEAFLLDDGRIVRQTAGGGKGGQVPHGGYKVLHEPRPRGRVEQVEKRMAFAAYQARKKAPAPPPAPARGFVLRQSGAVTGSYTLPVELLPNPAAGPAVRFTSLGDGELVVNLTSVEAMRRWWTMGAVLIAAAGLALIKRRPLEKAYLIVGVLAAASLMATWWPGTTRFANGAFTAGACLIPFYLGVALLRWLGKGLGRLSARLGRHSAPAVAMIAMMLLPTAVALSEPAAAPPAQPSRTERETPPQVIPYQGDPTQAEAARKVLIPYGRFVRLWNLAHPDQRIETPTPAASISLAGVEYAASVTDERMTLTLTAQIQTFGTRWVTVPMPISGLAVTAATLDGKDAQLRVGPDGMVLTLPGGISGRLKVAAVTTPKYLGRRGSVDLSLPPLPGAVMKVALPEPDLVLEAPGVEGVLTSVEVPGGVEWTVPLGARQNVRLLWSPKAGGGAIDRTLTASASHEVHVHHWALVGVSKLAYAFSAGEHDRFTLLLPEGLTVTDLVGANVRDYRVTGQRKLEGLAFDVLDVRLHRPTSKAYEVTVRWLAPLPALDKPARLVLPRTAGVGRESGTLTLHTAGGMSLKVAGVSGGRRMALPVGPMPRASKAIGREPATAVPPADGTVPVAKYYWPYRPFEVTVRLARPAVAPQARLDQLVRISTDRVQLLVNAAVSAREGRVFGCSFALPDGYELLSVAGGPVGEWYLQPAPTERRLHVSFRSGVTQAGLALVLVREKPDLQVFDVPTVRLIDAEGSALAEQTGRLAVQVAPSLEAQTVGCENLRPIRPAVARDWLEARQVQAVQFAYSYEEPKIALRLNIRRQPTDVRVEVLGALAVQPTSAWYTYRLRYTIDGSPIERVVFTLPSEYAPLVAVASPAMRNVAVADAGEGLTRWTVSLTSEVTGVLDVTVNFALPIDAATSALTVPLIQTEAPAGYRAILGVQNASRHELSLAASTALSPLSAAEQRRLLNEQARKSLQYVFQTFTDQWELTLGLKPAKPAKRVQAVVDLLAMTTVIDRDGRCRYEVKLALQNRAEQFLRVKVPAGLRLWSAIVAGQAVKPARPDADAEEQVLIPLVKTSPTGLPYEVKLYFAGKALPPMGTITRLAPPAIGIVGMPVMRTTWSLRLPGGYRYVRPGGNVSPVAGQAEAMTVLIDAGISQLERLEKGFKELAVHGSAGQKKMAYRNWDDFNERLGGQITQARKFIEANRNELAAGDYRRLRAKLDSQAGFQQEMQAEWKQAQRAEQTRRDWLLNELLNRDATNLGVAENVREGTLNTIPLFVDKAAKEQLEGMSEDLARADRAARVVRGRRGAAGPQDVESAREVPTTRPAVTIALEAARSGRDVGGLTKEKDRRLELRMAKRQAQVADEVRNLQDYYRQARGTITEKAGKAPARARPPAKAKEPSATAQEEAKRDKAVVAGVPVHVAGGMFSLPVELPAGRIALDFAGPGGEAALSIWAVRVGAIRALGSTGAVLVGLAIVYAALRLIRRVRFARLGTTGRLCVGYAALFVLLLLAGGALGLILWAGIVVIVEVARRLLARRAAARSDS